MTGDFNFLEDFFYENKKYGVHSYLNEREVSNFGKNEIIDIFTKNALDYFKEKREINPFFVDLCWEFSIISLKELSNILLITEEELSEKIKEDGFFKLDLPNKMQYIVDIVKFERKIGISREKKVLDFKFKSEIGITDFIYEENVKYNISEYLKFYKILSEYETIYDATRVRFSKKPSYGQILFLNLLKFLSTIESKIILFDEIEIGFHPEWQRNLLYYLIKFFNDENINIQIILTSHSPFVASDLPRENVIMLNTDKDGNCVVKNDKDIKTFGANIFDLYTDAFFVESSFGEFAKGKIKDVVKDLTLNEKGEYSDLSKERIKEIEYIINSIGEKLISAKLKKLYEEYRNNKNSEEYKKEQLKMLQEKLGLSNEQMINIIKTGDLQ